MSSQSVLFVTKLTSSFRVFIALSLYHKDWKEVCMDFIIALSRTQRIHEAFIMVINLVIKMTCLEPCYKSALEGS